MWHHGTTLHRGCSRAFASTCSVCMYRSCQGLSARKGHSIMSLRTKTKKGFLYLILGWGRGVARCRLVVASSHKAQSSERRPLLFIRLLVRLSLDRIAVLCQSHLDFQSPRRSRGPSLGGRQPCILGRTSSRYAHVGADLAFASRRSRVGEVGSRGHVGFVLRGVSEAYSQGVRLTLYD